MEYKGRKIVKVINTLQILSGKNSCLGCVFSEHDIIIGCEDTLTKVKTTGDKNCPTASEPAETQFMYVYEEEVPDE